MSAEEAAALHRIFAGSDEPEAQQARRARALALLETCLVAWAGDATSQVVVYGSVALQVHLPHADTDVVCVSASPKHARFFAEFPAHLAGVDGVDAVHCIEAAMPPLIKATIHGVKHDLLFCHVPACAGRGLPIPVDLSDDALLVGMDTNSRRSCGGPRLVRFVRNIVPNLDVFTLVLKAVKLWAARRGINGRQFGYPGGVSWLALVCAAVRQAPPAASPLAVLQTFFELYHGNALSSPVSMVDVPTTWRKGPDDKLAILVPFPTPPGTPLQMSNSCCGATCTLRALQAEMDRASFLFNVPGRAAEVWNRADFFGSFPRFLQIELRAVSAPLLDTWKAGVVSHFRDVLNHIDSWAAQGSGLLVARPFPFVFRSDRPAARLDPTQRADAPPDAIPGDHAGCIFVGLTTDGSAVEPDADLDALVVEAAGLLEAAVRSGFAELLGDWRSRGEGMFIPTVSIVDTADIPAFCTDGPPRPPPPRSGRAVEDIAAAFRAHGLDADRGCVSLQRVVAPASELVPLDPDDDAATLLPHGAIVALRAKAGGGGDGCAWVRTEGGAEGIVRSADLLDYAVAALATPPQSPRAAPPPETPLAPSTVYMTTCGEARLRALPEVEPCIWVEDAPAIPPGACVAVLGADAAGEFALVRHQGEEGFVRSALLSTAAGGVHAGRAAALKAMVLGLAAPGAMVAGRLPPIERALLLKYARRAGVEMGGFDGAAVVYRLPGGAYGAVGETATPPPPHPLNGPSAAGRCTAVRLDADSRQALLARFLPEGAAGAPRTLDVPLSPGADPAAAGAHLHLFVVARGTALSGLVCAGVVGCRDLSASPTPCVVVAGGGAPSSDDLAWTFLPPSAVLPVTGRLVQTDAHADAAPEEPWRSLDLDDAAGAWDAADTLAAAHAVEYG
eukprot:TRINITY_DN18630_c0_g2_i1.p1 TRINITY_DN18630_c0_g2~~TRINITY_DN18630_c0_g2_i1.p1  ORF type:complete len:948 (+),score=314.97 TRINITY_DN18630_c0_g2_i1:142-2844(+)